MFVVMMMMALARPHAGMLALSLSAARARRHAAMHTGVMAGTQITTTLRPAATTEHRAAVSPDFFLLVGENARYFFYHVDAHNGYFGAFGVYLVNKLTSQTEVFGAYGFALVDFELLEDGAQVNHLFLVRGADAVHLVALCFGELAIFEAVLRVVPVFGEKDDGDQERQGGEGYQDSFHGVLHSCVVV